MSDHCAPAGSHGASHSRRSLSRDEPNFADPTAVSHHTTRSPALPPVDVAIGLLLETNHVLMLQATTCAPPPQVINSCCSPAQQPEEVIDE
jgi:hypothetical protein